MLEQRCRLLPVAMGDGDWRRRRLQASTTSSFRCTFGLEKQVSGCAEGRGRRGAERGQLLQPDLDGIWASSSQYWRLRRANSASWWQNRWGKEREMGEERAGLMGKGLKGVRELLEGE
jgi:hypothetical protein